MTEGRFPRFDWPEQNHTSPTSTSLSVTVFLPVTVMASGPPAFMGPSRAVQQPPASAVASVRYGPRRDDNLFARLGRSPHERLHLALKDHVVAEDGGQFHFG